MRHPGGGMDELMQAIRLYCNQCLHPQSCRGCVFEEWQLSPHPQMQEDFEREREAEMGNRETGGKKSHKANSPILGPNEAGATAITDRNIMETPREYRKSTEKLAAFRILVQNGIDKRIAAETLGYKGKTAYALQQKIGKKGKTLDVASERMVNLAHRAVTNCLRGKPWGKISTIKDSTALAAAQVVVDRHQPKNAEPNTATYSFTQINLQSVQNDPDSLYSGFSHLEIRDRLQAHSLIYPLFPDAQIFR